MNQAKSIMSILAVGVILLSAILVNAAAQPLTDPTGDLLDSEGKPTAGEPYLDIIEVGLSQDGNNFVGTIKFNDNVPSKTSDPSVFIEWSLMIDSDRNPSTHPWGSWPLTVNDIGVDYMVELCADGSSRWGRIYDGPHDTLRGGNAKVQGNTITVTFSPSDIGGSTNFDYVALIRKYGQAGAPDALSVFDKAPNSGHYAFQATVNVTQTTTTTALSEQRLPSLPMEFTHATVYYNKGNEARARDMGDAFEYAYDHLEQDFPASPSGKFKLYVYKTRADLIQGLIAFSGMSPSQAEWYRQTGATPRPIRNIMHVSPNFGWHDVAHELTHTFIQEYSGDAYWQIKWLDEGLAGYEEWRCVLTDRAHSKEAEEFRQNSWQAFSELKTRGGPYPLNELTTDSQWTKLMEGGKSWYIYSEAFVVVAYLSSTYTPNKVIPILKKVEVGIAPPEAVKTVLGTTQEEILDAVGKASQSAIFQVSTATTTLVTTTSIIGLSTVTSTAPATTTQEPLTTTSPTSATTQEASVATRSTEEGTSTQPPTELMLAGAVVVAVAAVGVIVVRSRKKTSSSS